MNADDKTTKIRIKFVRMHKELITAHTRIEVFNRDFILKGGEQRDILIHNMSQSVIRNVAKSIERFLAELKDFEQSTHDSTESSLIREYVCSAKDIVVKNWSTQFDYFLNIFESGSPQSNDIDEIIQAFQDLFDCYNEAVERLLAT